jgi:D-arabinose 1-dehydrogenase-like Zn-dependent alcohol dehydrogenase
MAKAMGMRPIVVDTGDSKRDLSLEMGATAFVNFKEVVNPAKAVIDIADGVGVHGVFVTAPAAYKTAISYVGERIGTVVMCIGLPPAGSMVLGADPCQYVFQNLNIKGTLVGSQKDTEAALGFASKGLLRPICKVYPISRLPEAVEKLRNGQVAGRLVIDFNQE